MKPSASRTSSTASAAAMASGLPPKVLPWVPAVMPDGGFFGGQDGAHRKAAAEAFRRPYDVGGDAGPFIGVQLAGATVPRLHFVEPKQDAEFVGDGPQAFQIPVGSRPDAAFALHRFDQDAGRLRPDGGPHLVEIAEGDAVETLDDGAEALQMLFLAAGGQRRQGAAMKGAFGDDDAVALGMAGLVVILAHQLDDAFHRLGARIAKEDGVGKAVCDEPLGHLFLSRDAVQVGAVPQLSGLRLQGGDQMRVRVTKGVHRHAGTEIKETTAVPGEQIHTLAPFEGDVGARVGWHDGRDHSTLPNAVWASKMDAALTESGRISTPFRQLSTT